MIALPTELAVSAGMFLLTIAMHLTGLTLLVGLGRIHITRWRTPWLSMDRALIPMALATGVAVIHVAEVMAYAGLYKALGAAQTWEHAIFYSAASYSTAGLPDVDFDAPWRVVGALESLNGFILIGWSTAFLFETLHRIMNTEEDHPFPLGAIAHRRSKAR